MKLDRVGHAPFSHRVGRYQFQMAQARLNTPVVPVFTCNLQPFYARQQQWLTELSHSLARLCRFSAELDEAARQFARLEPSFPNGLRLLSETSDSVVSKEAQSEQLEDFWQKTERLVSRYNRLQAFLHEHKDILATHKLETFARVARAAAGPLRKFGFAFADNGTLELRESVWRSAVAAEPASYTALMKDLARQFRDEALRVKRTPLGSYSRWHDDLYGKNPYRSRLWSSLHYRYAAAVGTIVDYRW